MRLFAMCQSMKWNHLPVAGGLYDQSPQLLEEWEVLFEVQAAHQKAQQERQENEARNRSRR